MTTDRQPGPGWTKGTDGHWKPPVMEVGGLMYQEEAPPPPPPTHRLRNAGIVLGALALFVGVAVVLGPRFDTEPRQEEAVIAAENTVPDLGTETVDPGKAVTLKAGAAEAVMKATDSAVTGPWLGAAGGGEGTGAGKPGEDPLEACLPTYTDGVEWSARSRALAAGGESILAEIFTVSIVHSDEASATKVMDDAWTDEFAACRAAFATAVALPPGVALEVDIEGLTTGLQVPSRSYRLKATASAIGGSEDVYVDVHLLRMGRISTYVLALRCCFTFDVGEFRTYLASAAKAMAEQQGMTVPADVAALAGGDKLG